jgi:hypothetical protein
MNIEEKGKNEQVKKKTWKKKQKQKK